MSLFNAHVALFVQRMTQLKSHNLISKYRHLANCLWKLAVEVRVVATTVAICRPDNKQNRCGLGKNVNVRSSALEEACQ